MRYLQVLHNFGGRVTKERRIEPGIYAETDPALFGCAQYLLNNGHAVIERIEEPPPPPEPEPDPPKRPTRTQKAKG